MTSTLLAIDTATDACSVALISGNTTWEKFQLAPRQHAELILKMIDALLDEAKLRLQQLDAIAVGYGPGSFMGVRLAVSVAQGLAFGVKCPVIAVSSLRALAQSAYSTAVNQNDCTCDTVLAGWDARMSTNLLGFIISLVKTILWVPSLRIGWMILQR